MEPSEVNSNLDTILETEFVPEIVEEVHSQGQLIPVEERLPAPIQQEESNRDVEFDYELSRETHRDLIEQGQEALSDLLKVAKESQHPRAYEVAANMLKNLSDMTDKLMTLHKSKKELDGSSAPGKQTVNVDKAVFVGSTADLLKRIKHQ